MSGLSSNDYRVICRSLYPELEVDLVDRMVDFNAALNQEVVTKRLWGQAGAPWEFNLRDLLRFETCYSFDQGSIFRPENKIYPPPLTKMIFSPSRGL
jgi:midasin